MLSRLPCSLSAILHDQFYCITGLSTHLACELERDISYQSYSQSLCPNAHLDVNQCSFGDDLESYPARVTPKDDCKTSSEITDAFVVSTFIMVLNKAGVPSNRRAYVSVPGTRGLDRSSTLGCHGTESFISEEAKESNRSQSKKYHVSHFDQAKMVNFDRHQKFIALPTENFPLSGMFSHR